MALKIDKTTLQFEIKPNYDAQQLNKLKDDLTDANGGLARSGLEVIGCGGTATYGTMGEMEAMGITRCRNRDFPLAEWREMRIFAV